MGSIATSAVTRAGPGGPHPGKPSVPCWPPSIRGNTGSRRLPAASGAPSVPEDLADAVAAFVDVLLEAGILPQQPRALLDGPQGHAPRLARIQAHLQFARECDHAAYSMRSQELAY